MWIPRQYWTDQRLSDTQKAPDVRAFLVYFTRHYEETELGGWGARIRTAKWPYPSRAQNFAN